jgi:hypothetical protein
MLQSGKQEHRDCEKRWQLMRQNTQTFNQLGHSPDVIEVRM